MRRTCSDVSANPLSDMHCASLSVTRFYNTDCRCQHASFQAAMGISCALKPSALTPSQHLPSPQHGCAPSPPRPNVSHNGCGEVDLPRSYCPNTHTGIFPTQTCPSPSLLPFLLSFDTAKTQARLALPYHYAGAPNTSLSSPPDAPHLIELPRTPGCRCITSHTTYPTLAATHAPH